MQTFLWHDYETFGANPKKDRPAQFAAIRTDMELNEVQEPMEWFCKPPLDYLPDAQACLITGITPQQAMQKGEMEHVFADRIQQAFSQPETVGVGYNTIRFDDEFTRFLLWRNLLDPYAREWRDGNSRWDLLDVVRMTYALRPEGVNWPVGEDGKTSFKLELLSASNGLLHEAAHDAVSDVRATIALARLIRQKQPRLFEYALALRDKRMVAKELGFPAAQNQVKPFVHISGMFPVEQGCLAVMWPLANHPTNRNEVIAWNLASDPRELLDLDVQTIRQRLFSRQVDLPEGIVRLPIKSIHMNKSPMVVGNLKVLTPQVQQRWNMDMATLEQHALWAQALPDMSAIWAEVFSRQKNDLGVAVMAEQDLYGGFVSDADRKRLLELKKRPLDQWSECKGRFEDPRLDELVFFYRARNHVETLSEQEMAQWEQHRKRVLIEGYAGARTASQLMAEIDALSDDASEAQQDILGALYEWTDYVTPDW
ncbi:exodeoxyribonuclease I [Lampropedia puyangensis]|uniref:Exodeoxyribonuclease I n=1 Tax=Lampropedia puyangensis TaxID=1330072 RepID=A0A4S8FIS9_9BURK|nr:exodeoxyribonuclease I [Lampropedia puyangensis]THU05502.1 exodeoxyribonuclease I [Lampropedia puyangensis]